ncbi:hypothetical protein KJA14_01945 [Patescibacteria group bacterium]|nr:hypothetical protein [Patescibacteria group bacterium]
MTKIKINRKILLGIPLAIISFEIYLGIILGYFLGKFLSGRKTGQSGIIKSIVLNIGNYRLHFHHWLLSLGILIFNFLPNFSFPFSQFSLSFLGGLVIQGIFCYSDWHKIFIREI